VIGRDAPAQVHPQRASAGRRRELRHRSYSARWREGGDAFVGVLSVIEVVDRRRPEGVEVIPETSFFHNPPGGLGLPGGPHRPARYSTVCRQNISDGWLGNLREYLAHLV
jgi:hypothetical protein